MPETLTGPHVDPTFQYLRQPEIGDRGPELSDKEVDTAFSELVAGIDKEIPPVVERELDTIKAGYKRGGSSDSEATDYESGDDD